MVIEGDRFFNWLPGGAPARSSTCTQVRYGTQVCYGRQVLYWGKTAVNNAGNTSPAGPRNE